jgi:ribulose-bisphosphate carboxylase large chain
MERKLLKPDDYFSITYRVTPPSGVPPKDFAQNIAEEQTVEIPHESIPERHYKMGVVGTVDSIDAEKEGSSRVVIRYRSDITGFSIPQFLNVLFGNISLKNGIKIISFDLPEQLIAAFGGPQRGIDTIRATLGIYGRPLLATALKPLGLSCAELAKTAGSCARGGIDIIKDDHGIADQRFHPFEERICRVSEAIATANASSGSTTLYFPNICAPADRIEPQVELALRNGIRGILLAPQLVGFDMVRYLAAKYRIMIMAHPSFTGSLFSSESHGIIPSLFLGTLFRLIGADISIFPSWGGRFPFSRQECIDIAHALTEAMPPLRRAFPAPAGGIRLDRFADIADAYGEEAVLLVGGALLGDSIDLAGSVSGFLERVRQRFNEQRLPPDDTSGSSCEYRPGIQVDNTAGDVLNFSEFNWSGRERVAYRLEGEADFKDIQRIELTGGSGNRTAFDLRYFEIGAGGYSSFEKHLHEHVIIGVRGCGVLVKSGRRLAVRPNDIASIGQYEPHQLRNEQETPFGFYCIVDKKRDRPQPVQTVH